MAPIDGQSQKDDDGHLRNKLCALWTNNEPEARLKQTNQSYSFLNELMNAP